MKNQENPIDISIENGDKFIVDKRLLNILIHLQKPVDLLEVKEKVRMIVEKSNTVDNLFDELDAFIYMNKIVNLENYPKNEKL